MTATTGPNAWWRDPAPRHLADVARRTAHLLPDRVTFQRRRDDDWVPVTATEFWDEAVDIAKGLVAKGCRPGDRVALMSANRYEWQLLDFACWIVGAVVVPVDAAAEPDHVHHILTDSGCSAAFLETPQQQDMVEGLGSRLPDLREAWIITRAEGSAGLASLATAGEPVPDSALQERIAALSRSSLASIVYSSGSTGPPRGARLTHGGMLSAAQAVLDALQEVFSQDATLLLSTPMSHVSGRSAALAALLAAVPVGHGDVASPARDLRSLHPTILVTVPSGLDALRAQVRHAATEAGRRRLFDKAEAVALAYSEQLDGPAWQRRLTGTTTGIAHRAYRKQVFDPVRREFGGELRWTLCGGSALQPDLLHFFRGMGIGAIEGYGLTETSGVCAINRAAAQRPGCVGTAVPGVEVRTDGSDEVQVLGPSVFDGYWDDEEASNAAFTDDGWYRTGDVGYLDEGHLTLVGRLADAITTSRERVIHPAPLEEVVATSQYVEHCVVVGHGRDHVSALITLAPDVLADFQRERDLEHEPWETVHDHPDLQTDLRLHVSKANALVDPEDRIHNFRILPTRFTVESGHLTPAGRIHRPGILRDFARDVDSLY